MSFRSKVHQSLDRYSVAYYSPCQQYRYLLTRRWDVGKMLVFIMLNPSTATESGNDPTIERCEQRAQRWGYGGIHVLNLFALRATRPQALLAHPEPVGALNDFFLRRLCSLKNSQATIVLAWGNHGTHQGRAEIIRESLASCCALYCLRMNKSGEPVHPLYVAYNEPLKSINLHHVCPA